MTGVAGTFIDVDGTILSIPPCATGAVETINFVGACSLIFTRVAGTFVYIDVAVFTLPSFLARAIVGIQTFCATGPILTEVAGTFVDGCCFWK